MHPKGIFYLGIALITYAFTHVSDKLGVASGVEPATFTFFQIVVGVLFIGFVWLALRKKQKLKFKKKYIKNLVILGVVTTGIALSMMVFALQYTTATNRAVMQGMFTACTVLFAYFMIHERVPKLFYPTLCVIIVGLVLLTSEGLLALPNKGDWILLAAVPLIGFGNVYAKQTMEHLDSLTVSFGRYFFGLLFLILLLPFVGLENISTIENGMVWAICSGVLSGICLIAFYKAIEIVGPTLAATGLTIAPAITVLSAFLILGETLNPLQILGLVLILGGALLITRMKASYLN